MMGVTALDASIWHSWLYKRVLGRAFRLGDAAKDIVALRRSPARSPALNRVRAQAVALAQASALEP
jgi:hypothetical protein